METSIALLGPSEALLDVLDLVQLSVLEGLVDADDLHVAHQHDRPSTRALLTSCQTTLPAPMFRWPTSLFPIRPSGSPTASEDASSSL